MKHWVAIFLVMLVALQCVTVAADVHRFHQSQNLHLELTPSEHADQHHLDRSKGAKESIADCCGHCCHCHGSFVAALASHTPASYVDRSLMPLEYRLEFSSAQPSSLFRPPKA